MTQADYCRQHQLNVLTFGARRSDYRKSPQLNSSALALIPVQVEPVAAEALVFTDAHSYRLELPMTVSARWLAELLKCLA